jgi:tRNA A-37 threonylcarbamoyl transferase component Bud32
MPTVPPNRFEVLSGEGTRVMAQPGFAAAALDLVTSAQEPAERGRARKTVLPVGEGVVVAVRHYFHGGLLWMPLPRNQRDLYLSMERAERELKLYTLARERGIPTLEPLAVVGRRAARWFWRLDMISRWIGGSEDLRTALRSDTGPEARGHRCQLLAASGRAVRRLHDAGFEHADLHFGNILVRWGDAGAAEAFVIDLDRTRVHPGPVPQARRVANLVRLYRSAHKHGRWLQDPPGVAEALAFVRAYAGDDRELRRVLAVAVRAFRPWLRVRSLFWPGPGSGSTPARRSPNADPRLLRSKP